MDVVDDLPATSTIKVWKRFGFDHDLKDDERVEAAILACLKSYKVKEEWDTTMC